MVIHEMKHPIEAVKERLNSLSKETIEFLIKQKPYFKSDSSGSSLTKISQVKQVRYT